MTPSTLQPTVPQLHLIPSSVKSIAQQQGALINPSGLERMGCIQPFDVWLQVAGRIFKAIPAPHYPPRLIGLPFEECLLLPPPLVTQGVNISVFKQGRADLRPLNTLFVDVFYKSSRATISSPFVMMKDEIINVIRPALRDQFFFDGQSMIFPLVGAALDLTFRLPIEGDRDQPFSIQQRTYAFVGATTSIAIKASSPRNLKILNGFRRASDALVSLQVHAPTHSTAEELTLLHNDDLKRLFYQAFAGKFFHVNQQLALDVPNMGSLRVTLYSLRSPTVNNLSTYSIKIEEGQVISFFSEESTLKILHGAPRIARQIAVEIKDIHHREEAGTFKLPRWVVAADLTRSIKQKKPGFVPNEKMTLTTADFAAKAAITTIDYDGMLPKLDQHWKLGRHSHVAYKMDCGEVPLVDTNISTLLRSITFEISIPKWTAPLELSYDRVLRAVMRHARNIVATDQRITFTLRGVPHPIWARAALLNPVEPTPHIYGFLGTIRNSTEKKLECVSNQLNLVRISPAEALADPAFHLRELGLGGLSKECISTLKQLLLMNTSVRSELESRSVIPPTGILIHGPSGTGKTLLAKAMRQLLGIPKSRFHLATGSALVGSCNAETTQNIKKLFSSIPKESSTHLHLVVIDNLEALEGNQLTLKAELHALEGRSNLFVIGICEDAAVIAPELVHRSPKHIQSCSNMSKLIQ